MKTRNGYVSNSSSSSFLVYGNECDFNEIESRIEEGKNVICADYGGGFSGDCADFVFKMTKERLELLKPYFGILRRRGVSIISVDFSLIEDYFDEKTRIPALKGGKFFEYSRDYSSPHTDSVDDEDFKDWLENQVKS